MLSRLLIFLVLVFSPALLCASNCSDIANQINADNEKYSTSINKQSLPWMHLTWLQQKLGLVQGQKIAENQIQYKWTCPENADTNITVLADNNGTIISIDDVYSSMNGAGIASICLAESCSKSVSTAAENQQIPMQSQNSTTTTNLSCEDIIKQIYDVSQHSGSVSVFPWEDMAWMQKKFGPPLTRKMDWGYAYGWECFKGRPDVIVYNVRSDSSAIISSMFCSAGTCYITSTQRKGGVLKGILIKMTMPVSK